MRQFVIIIAVVVLIAGAALGISLWISSSSTQTTPLVSSQEEKAALAEVKELLQYNDLHHSVEALEIISLYQNQILQPTEEGREWTNLFLTACVQAENYQLLIDLYEFSPETFSKREDAALMVATAYLMLQNVDAFNRLQGEWLDKAQSKDQWFLLDAGKLIAKGQRDEARKLLESKTLEGDAEIGRLIRLAMFHLKENPDQAWEYLSQAYKLNPHDSEIRSLRAKFLETYGKVALARSEYLAAVALDIDNATLRDQLAEFYRRQNKYALAIKTWQDALSLPYSDTLWTKALFWSRMIRPFEMTELVCPEGALKDLVDYYRILDPNTYWDQEVFKEDPNLSSYLHSEQSTFWMRLVQLLKDGQEDKAFELIQANPFTPHSWNRDLELALKRILHYRQTGEFSFPSIISKDENKHALFAALDELCATHSEATLTNDLMALLRSKEIFAAAFAASGWYEAALQLHRLSVIPDNFPGWVAYGIAQGFRNNREPMEALSFISKQLPTPPLQLLEGEVLITQGNLEAAINKLSSFAEENSIIGYRASWLLSMLYMEKKDFTHAKAMVDKNPRLQRSVLGQETLARIALREGNDAEAHKIYTLLENHSSEAMSYLARRAYADKNYKRARELTEKLLKKHPANMTLRQNLKLIIEEQESNEN